MSKTLRDRKSGQFRGRTADSVRVPDTGAKSVTVVDISSTDDLPTVVLPVDVTYEKFRELNSLTNQGIADDPTLAAPED